MQDIQTGVRLIFNIFVVTATCKLVETQDDVREINFCQSIVNKTSRDV